MKRLWLALNLNPKPYKNTLHGPSAGATGAAGCCAAGLQCQLPVSNGQDMQCYICLLIPHQVHGFPRVMGVLTHLDGFRDDDKLKKVKKALKHRFWTEIYQGAAPIFLCTLSFLHRSCRFRWSD